MREIPFNNQVLYFYPEYLISPLGMLLVFIGFSYFVAKKQLSFKIFFWGGLLWFLTIAMKAGVASIAVPPVVEFLKANLNEPVASIFTWIYIGLFTGIFECIPIYLFFRWKYHLTTSDKPVFSFGYGYGAFESLALGLAALISILLIFTPEKLPEVLLKEFLNKEPPSILVLLMPAIERLATVFMHVTSVVLIALAISKENIKWFWYSFVFKSFIDTVAAATHQLDLKNETTLLLVELFFVTIGTLCIFMNRRLKQRF